MKTQSLNLIGSTGSIGTQTLKAIERLNKDQKKYDITGISAHSSKDFFEQLRLVKPKAYSFGEKIRQSDARYFKDSVQMIEYLKPDICVIASGGSDSLKYTQTALKNSSRVCLANKESMIMAGQLIRQTAKDYNCELIPIDSEHSSLFQLIHDERFDAIEKVYITASGGALRDWPLEKLACATVEDVLKHPNWVMGKKITVDSATMFNKGMEVIEAKELFGFKKEQIKTALCYSSYVHSLVVFKDGSVKIHAGEPDMTIPIAYSLTWPERGLRGKKQDVTLDAIELKEMDTNQYPALELAYQILEGKNSLKIAYNASNEVAVELFLDRKIGFMDIFHIVNTSVNETEEMEFKTIDEIMDYQGEVKKKIIKKWRR